MEDSFLGDLFAEEEDNRVGGNEEGGGAAPEDKTEMDVINWEFVKDQEGMMIGFDHFGKERKDKEEVCLNLYFMSLHKKTSITLYAVYTEPEKK